MRLESVIEKIDDILKAKVPRERFSVRSPNKPLINDDADGFPVMVSCANGDYEARENLLLESPNFQIQVLIPSDREELAEAVFSELAKAFVGKMVVFGSGATMQGGICNMSSKTQNAVERLDIDTNGVYSSVVNELFGNKVKDLRMYTAYDCVLYVTTGAKAGGCSNNDDGVLFGNQIDHYIEFDYDDDGTTRTEYEQYSNVNTDRAMASHPYSRQSLNDKSQGSTEQSTAYTKSVTMIVKNNSFFKRLLAMYCDKSYQGARFGLSTKIALLTNEDIQLDDDDNLMCQDMTLSDEPGAILTVTLTLSPRIEVQEP